ncbi:MAG TPA: aldehyde dehydrogenase family protein [Candidatus Limnocylindrales bacterium]|jgi:acyl-CoA reductase-like NAD-dependent aldehyde dehydrogenase|nr:aldehyde dehydrogenase family protein [Candidatus Limnocylindrales bacterium]
MSIAERLVSGADTDVATQTSFIDGRFIEAGDADRIEVRDPATWQLIARIADAGEDGVERAVTAAEAAHVGWRRTPARERAALIGALADRLEAKAEELAQLDALDTGNPLVSMRADVAKGIHQMHEAAGLALETKGETFPLPGLHYTAREPWGVVARLVTFNHPAMFTAARIATALVAGNCVIIKPSELAPLSPLAIAEITAGVVPDGVINVVVGGPATGAAIAAHPRILRITFTGSTPTALRIQAAAAASGRVKSMTFELGGKNPIVVFPDVDLDETAAAIVRGMNFARVQGQSCGATSRLIVHESIAEAVLERVVDRTRKIRIGMPSDPSTEMGAMITKSARSRVVDMVERATGGGARVLTGGHAIETGELGRGAFLEPTVVDGVARGSELADVEVFGPVLAAMTFTEESEAVALANDGPFGLTAAVWTQDIDRAFRLANAIETGYVWINDVETRFPAVPFGGWGDSGVGLEHGIEEVLSMTRLKAVNVRLR